MAVFHPHVVECACGNKLNVNLADSINVKRSPETREQILRGELHRASCSVCARQMTVEKPFYYTDLTRNVLFKVCPRGERHKWKETSSELDRASGLIPEGIAGEQERTLRVIFGMDELREKLVAQDAGLDDRVLELLKVMLVHEHPVLLRRPRLRLTLENAGESDLEFSAAYEHAPQRFGLRIARRAAEEVSGNDGPLRAWSEKAHGTSVFELPDHWVNMWRWSPQPAALDRLRGYAEEIKAGRTIPTAKPEFQQMLDGIPRGSHLPSWAKQDLRTLFEYVKKKGGMQKLQDALFEVRFGVELDDDWSTNNDLEDIDTLWKLLKDLPDTNVEGNTKINEIKLDRGGGGTYDPSTHDISIGADELVGKERFEDVVRHEVGHAVHEMKDELVNGWLAERFGWQAFDATDDAHIDQWVALLGGWGALNTAQQRDVRTALRTALGKGGNWSPGAKPALPAGHPWLGAAFGPRLAYEKTEANWFRNCRTWHRANGKAFFLNYWYQTLHAVDVATVDLILKMPDLYAAMSHYEFFAELYALYYDLEDKEDRKAIPADVAKWIDDNIGAPERGAPMPAAPRRKRDYETTTRPEGKR